MHDRLKEKWSYGDLKPISEFKIAYPASYITYRVTFDVLSAFSFLLIVPSMSIVILNVFAPADTF